MRSSCQVTQQPKHRLLPHLTNYPFQDKIKAETWVVNCSLVSSNVAEFSHM